MAFRTTIRNAGDLTTEHIAGSESEFIIETAKFTNSQQQTVSNFTELRGISTKSQIMNVIGTGSFERQTYVAQVDDNLNTIVTTDQTYAYVRHPGTLLAHLSDNTTVAVSGIEGVASVTGGIANGVPPYIYGRDAAWVLQRFLSTGPKAMVLCGDSRTVDLAKYAGKKWTNVPLGGCSALCTSATATNYTHHAQARVPNVVHASFSFAGINYTDWGLGRAVNECICTLATARNPANHLDNVLQGGSLARADVPLILGAFDGRYVNCCWPLLLSPLGSVAARFTVQTWNSSGYTSAPNWAESEKFATLGAANRLTRKHIMLGPTAAIGASLITQLRFDNSLNVLGEVIAASEPWFELSEPYGLTIHDFAYGGTRIEDYNPWSLYATQGQFPDATLEQEFAVRTQMHEAWALIDLGTNGLFYDGHWMSQLDFEAQLTSLIGRLRHAAHEPTMPIILRSAYHTSSDLEHPFWQLAERAVASRVPNVMLVDTYEMVQSIGGYAAIFAKGWIGDGIHLSVAGREWLEAQFNSMLVGDPIVAP